MNFIFKLHDKRKENEVKNSLYLKNNLIEKCLIL